MTHEIDARGLACPAPVLAAKTAIETQAPKALTVLVDNDAARQNVSRFLESNGYQVSSAKREDAIAVSGTRTQDVPARPSEPRTTAAPGRKIMVLVSSDTLGQGDDELGGKLMQSFLKTLNEMGPDLWRLVFVNGGVKLTIEGAASYAALKGLQESGIHILVCGTCLNHFQLDTAPKAGETTNMLDIVTAMQVADKIISL